MDKKNRNRGFTLMELIIVVAIVAILSALISVNLLRYLTKAKKAMDKVTAEEIANAYKLAAVTNPVIYDLMNDWRTSKYSRFHTTVSATVDGVTETYKVSLIVSTEDNTYFSGKQAEYEAYHGLTNFYNDLNAELGLTETKGANPSMRPRYEIKKEGTYAKPNDNWKQKAYEPVCCWRIVVRLDNGDIEVWAADRTTFGGWPQFRVYPNPDDAYN